MEDAKLGALVRSHHEAHDQVVELRAELEKIGEELILLGTNLTKDPGRIQIGEADIKLTDESENGRVLIRSSLETAGICQKLAEFQRASAHQQQTAQDLRNAGMGHIVYGLDNRHLMGGPAGGSEPYRDVLGIRS